MSERDIVTDMFDNMTALEDMGCELVIRDAGIRAAYTCYKNLSGKADLKYSPIKVFNERNHMSIIIENEDSSEYTCGMNALQTAAQAVMKQAPFMLKNPYMFSGCIMEI